MFQNLKHRNSRDSRWEDRPPAGTESSSGISPSANATSYQVKGNEATRMVRCKTCGFPCDIERDGKANYDTWGDFGINQGTQLTAGTSIGDKRVPTAGTVNQTPDKYYDRVVSSGCPNCGSLVYWTNDIH